MAYKIKKYKGKTRIEDTKTGKSREIDVERFLNETPKKHAMGYNKQNDDPPFDWVDNLFNTYKDPNNNQIGGWFDDMYQEGSQNVETPNDSRPYTEQDKGKYNNPVTEWNPFADDKEPYSGPTPQSTEQPNQGAEPPESTTPIGDQDTERKRGEDTSLNGDEDKDPNNQDNGNDTGNDPTNLNGGDDPNSTKGQFYNPYGSTDIQGAAYYLGKSLQDGNGAMGAFSGGKLATGLARNLLSGAGFGNRYEQLSKEARKEAKKNTEKYEYKYGGKKDEEMATGEYMRGLSEKEEHMAEDEVEKGEYYKTKEGDVAEVVGKKHPKGGEKVLMEVDDKVISDELKLGGKNAKFVRDNYDIKVKAKNTFSDVLKKFRKKSKLNNLIEEEAELIKKIDAQQNTSDISTRDINLQVLKKNMEEVSAEKQPLKKQEKVLFNRLYRIQEAKKKEKGEKYDPKNIENRKEDNKKQIEKRASGGRKESSLEEYIKTAISDGKPVPYIDWSDPSIMKAANDKLTGGDDEWDKIINGDRQNPNKPEVYYTDSETVQQNDKDKTSDKIEDPNDFLEKQMGEYKYSNTPQGSGKNDGETFKPWESVMDFFQGEDTSENNEENKESSDENVIDTNMPMWSTPNNYPYPPSSLQGTLKPDRNYSKVSAQEIDVEPYLQNIREKEQAQIRALEGLSPNVRAAAMANIRNNSMKQESQIRSKINARNIQSRQRTEAMNNQIENRQENADYADSLKYEQRMGMAQAKTENDLYNYLQNLQDVNMQKYEDVRDLNLMNANSEHIYFDGQRYRKRRKGSDIIKEIKERKTGKD